MRKDGSENLTLTRHTEWKQNKGKQREVCLVKTMAKQGGRDGKFKITNTVKSGKSKGSCGEARSRMS